MIKVLAIILFALMGIIGEERGVMSFFTLNQLQMNLFVENLLSQLVVKLIHQLVRLDLAMKSLVTSS